MTPVILAAHPLRYRAALCAIALAAYFNSFGLDLAFDGRRMVRDDPRIRSASAANLRLIATTDYWYPDRSDRLYRPLTTASYLLNYTILGNADHAAGYHALNFLLHLANVWLVFALGLRLFNRAGPAFLAAALWAVHPIGTEVVANVAGRADLLATFCLLGGLLLYIRMEAMPAKSRRTALAGLFAISLAGMLSKETGILLFALMLLWDLTFGLAWNYSGRPALLSRVPAYAAVLAPLPLYLLARQQVFSERAWTAIPFIDNPLAGAGFWTARWTAIKVIGLDLRLLLWPSGLSFDRSYAEIPLAGAGDPWAWAALAVILFLLALVVIRYRRDRLLFWATGFFGITLLPVANLLVLIGATMAERFLYLPAIGFAVAVTALVHRAASQRVASGILAVAILLCAAVTIARNPAWQDDYSIAAAGVETAPRSFRAHRLLAAILYNRGAAGNLDATIREAEAAWSILEPLPPDRIDQQAPAALGYYYRMKGDSKGGPTTPEGRAWYEKSAAVLQRGAAASQIIQKEFDEDQLAHGKPLPFRAGFENLYTNLGKAQAGLGQYADALASFHYAREINPGDRAIYDELATLYATQGNLDAAVLLLNQKALLFGFSSATSTSLRNLYSHLPDAACAMAAGGSGVNPDCPRVHNDLCLAWSDLVRVFNTARLAGRARSFEFAMQKYGCPVPAPR
jgi:tetratricopeptide (TPR) repeat protein